MKLYCPECGKPIPDEQLDLPSGLVKCAHCNAVLNLRQRLERQGRRRTGQEGLSSPLAVARPEGWKVEDFGGSWSASWHWFGWQYLGLALFCVAWDSFLIFWYKMALTHNGPWLMIIFPIGHVAVGVWLTYSVIAGFFNHTRLEVRPGRLSIRHGPLPWRGNAVIPTSQIMQLYCQHAYARKRGMSYQLSAVMKDGRKVILLRGFESADEPKFLERELESRIQIEPQRVAGEYA